MLAALAAFVAALAALLAGRPWLGAPTLLFGIPVGNLLAWVLACSLPFMAWQILRTGLLRWPAGILLALGVLWLAVSILLAGNVNLNFTGGWRLHAWLAISGICLVGPVALVIVHAIGRAAMK